LRPHPDTKLSIKLRFLKEKSSKKRAEFRLSDDMVSVLKSELNPQGAAKMVGAGFSFKKIAKLISTGGKMTHLNRLLQNKTLSTVQLLEISNNKNASQGEGYHILQILTS
jgi:hypothetical protein